MTLDKNYYQEFFIQVIIYLKKKLRLLVLIFPLQSIDNYDITGDGMKDLIVGRHDGNIEIYAYDDDSEPILKFAFVSFFFQTFAQLLHFN